MEASGSQHRVERPRQSGLVAFFDILGYQNFVLNNDVEQGVLPILQALATMPTSLRSEYLNGAPEAITAILDDTEHLVFSDTILLTCPVKADLSEADQLTRWFVFTLQAGLLQRKMFHFGFPIRGAITFGNFVREKSCFAGRAIIEAYQLVGELDAAAVVFSPQAGALLSKLVQTQSSGDGALLARLAVEYLVPTKTLPPQRRWTVDFTRFGNAGFPSLEGDARALVAECFWKHNKDLPQSAYAKLTNTELLLRYLRTTP